MIDLNVLKELYLINSRSRKEKEMKDYLKGLFPFSEDNFGNLFIKKGDAEKFPCFVAHLDEVHTKGPTHIVQIENILFGYDVKHKEQTGIGADDKNGIYTCLNLLEKLDNVKIVLFVEEETGGLGAKNFNISFFEDCQFIVEVDRRNGSDLITKIGGSYIASKAFRKDLLTLSKVNGFFYKETDGLFTDVDYLSDKVGISCINLSCGYFNPHMNDECTDISLLENTIEFCLQIAALTKTYKFKREKPVYQVLNKYNPNSKVSTYYPSSLNYNHDCYYYCNDYHCSDCSLEKKAAVAKKGNFRYGTTYFDE